MNRLLFAPALAAVAVSAMLLVSVAGAQEPGRTDTPEDLTDAIERYVESNGGIYAGDCLEIPQDGSTLGQHCSVIESLDDDTAVVHIGKVATDEIETVTFTKIDGEWQAEGEQPQTEVPQGLMDAINGYILAFDGTFAGLCSEQDGNPGEYCATVENLTETSATVYIGKVASDEITTVQFVQQNGVWDAPATEEPQEPQQPSFPQELLDAIDQYTEKHFGEYAGLCSEQDGQAGQFCATIENLTATSATVYIGKVASDEIHTVPFTVIDGEWQGEVDQPEPGVPQDLLDAISDYVDGIGGDFAGLCEEQDGQAGQYCATVEGLTDSTATVHIGKVASDEIHTVIFNKVNGVWMPHLAEDDLDEAMEDFIEGLGGAYAGLCSEQDAKAGEFCATIQGQTDGTALVRFTRAGSNSGFTMSFVKVNGDWRAEAELSDVLPLDLEYAVIDYLNKLGVKYAGQCSEKDAAEGEFCIVLKSLTGDKASIEFTKVGVGVYRTETFVKANGSWKLEAPAPAPQAPAELVKAIEAYVKSLGKQFAGACEDANPGTDAGKYCYIVTKLEAERAVVSIGAVASDEVKSVVFLKGANGWRLGGTGGNGTPTPPNTGTGGGVDNGGDDTMLYGIGLIGLGTLAAAGAITLAKRRSSDEA